MSIADELKNLSALHVSGAISTEEFEQAKRKVLNSGAPPSSAPTNVHSCRRCHSPDVRNLKLIIDEGSWDERSTSRGTAAGVANGGLAFVDTHVKTKSEGRSRLAAKLQPPAAPQMSAIMGGCGVISLVCAVVFSGNGDSSLAFGVIAVFFFVVEAVTYRSRHAEYLEEKAVWQDKMQVWARSSLCARCGTIFDPVTGLIGEADHLKKYLNAAAKPGIDHRKQLTH
jgi:hypothetical protein